ncbi:ferrous iron transport protein B [Timonella sp. A28]|uniref:ferrous iron transport protein B n=1 Tax=Timonella sp. A28 TaxID=3442640 RepID=UPI003EB744B4
MTTTHSSTHDVHYLDALQNAPRIALIGRPNAGKSTLFNALTGAHQKTMNVPRTTVNMEIGTWTTTHGTRYHVIDTPGTYSLVPQSPDEEVTADTVRTLVHRPHTHDRAIVVLDATALSSSLYILAQTMSAGMPVIAALTKTDAHTTPISAQKLEQIIGAPVVELNPRRRQGLNQLDDALASTMRAQQAQHPLPPNTAPAQTRTDHHAEDTRLQRAHQLFTWVNEVIAQLGHHPNATTTRSDRIDSYLLKPLIGIPFFLAVLWATLQLTTTVAGPLQDWFEQLITGPVTQATTALLTSVQAPQWVHSLVVDGVLSGVGTVVSFLPLMMIIFTLIHLLEDSGYLARVAVMADKAMNAIGLDGRAVLPLVLAFGCNIPALSATKTIPQAPQRALTGLLIPFASCTARLVIYLLLASAFFPQHAGTVVFGMYLLSTTIIVAVAWTANKIAPQRITREPLVIVLPRYQTPLPTPLLHAVGLKTLGFMKRAGIVIVVLSMAVWALLSIPTQPDYTFADETMPLETSLFGSTASAIAPIFEPAGFNDWHATAALITGFVAKEAVVGTLATTYGIDEPADPTQAPTLDEKLRTTFQQSSGGEGNAAALAYMVFCLVYTPCLVTVAEQRRLFGTRFTVAAVGAALVGGWVLAVVVFQIAAVIA